MNFIRPLRISCLLLLTLITSCSRLFESSPYTPSIPAAYTDLNTAVNKSRIESIQPAQPAYKGQLPELKIALLADPHYGYDKLRDAINEVNKDSAIAFVILCGDYSDQGLEGEYVEFYEQLKLLNKPFLTVIGNHDYLANAASIYGQMFGPANYIFDYSGYRFIFFDDIFWEKNGVPDFNWLETQLAGAGDEQPVVIAHIPPDGDQFDTASRARYEGLMEQYAVPLSIHGHNHTYQFRMAGNTVYYTVPATLNRQYCTVTLRGRKPGPLFSLLNY